MTGNGWVMGMKAYSLYNRRGYPVQSVNKQNEERQPESKRQSRVVAGAMGAFCEVQSMLCDGNSRVCQFREISARILDDRINTIAAGFELEKALR